jgi:hypothetical protein
MARLEKEVTEKHIDLEVKKEIKVEETATTVTPKAKPKPTWEIKDRNYYLLGNVSSLTYSIPTRHSARYPLLWLDEENGEQKELRYTTNHSSSFVEDQKGEAVLGHIVFEDGALFVPKEMQSLQKMLSLYHPFLNKRYAEFDGTAEAEDELEDLELELVAMNAAKDLDIDAAEAIMRVELGSAVSKMSSKEIKRDLMLFAKRNPALFIELANDDNVQLRNFAIRAAEAGIIRLSQDQRTFHWGANDRKLMTVPFDENPYSAMAAFFKTDEGVEIYRSIEKKL